jgi:hypothetical protein
VRLPQHHRDFLDNSSEGSLTSRTKKLARDLFNTIANNDDVWDLDKYSCIENFFTTILFEELSKRFGLGPHVLVEVTKCFANHLNVPKIDLMFMLNLLKILHICF